MTLREYGKNKDLSWLNEREDELRKLDFSFLSDKNNMYDCCMQKYECFAPKIDRDGPLYKNIE